MIEEHYINYRGGEDLASAVVLATEALFNVGEIADVLGLKVEVTS
jgi:hypothetical protein